VERAAPVAGAQDPRRRSGHKPSASSEVSVVRARNLTSTAVAECRKVKWRVVFEDSGERRALMVVGGHLNVFVLQKSA